MSAMYVKGTFLTGYLLVIVTSCGLHLMADKSYLGTSPNGLVTCTSVDILCNGWLEIKCLYSIDGSVTIKLSTQGIAEKFGNKFFMKFREDGCHMTMYTMFRYRGRWLL